VNSVDVFFVSLRFFFFSGKWNEHLALQCTDVIAFNSTSRRRVGTIQEFPWILLFSHLWMGCTYIFLNLSEFSSPLSKRFCALFYSCATRMFHRAYFMITMPKFCSCMIMWEQFGKAYIFFVLRELIIAVSDCRYSLKRASVTKIIVLESNWCFLGEKWFFYNICSPNERGERKKVVGRVSYSSISRTLQGAFLHDEDIRARQFLANGTEVARISLQL